MTDEICNRRGGRNKKECKKKTVKIEKGERVG
jgi:hypothetical protein